MSERYVDSDAAVNLLERRWFAAVAAAKAMQSECEVLKAVVRQAEADLALAQKPIAALCAAGSTVTSTQLLTAVQQALPAFAIVVAEIPLPPAQEAQIQGA